MRRILPCVLLLAAQLVAFSPAEEKADVAALKAVLASGADPAARMGAAKQLGLSGDPAAAEPLMRALKDEERPVRWAAIEALGDLRDRSAVPPLLEYLKKKEAYRWGKILAANALASIGDPAAVEPLLALAHDEDPILKRVVIMALGKLGDPRAFPPALDLLKDDTPWLRRAAQFALVHLAQGKLQGEAPRGYEAWTRWYEAEGRPGSGAAGGH